MKVVGIRPGEKIHEILLTEDEPASGLDMGSFFVIQPRFEWWGNGRWPSGCRVEAQYPYASDANERWLSPDELRRLIGTVYLVAITDYLQAASSPIPRPRLSRFLPSC